MKSGDLSFQTATVHQEADPDVAVPCCAGEAFAN